MNKQDIKRNLPVMTGRLGKDGYDRWCHSFAGKNKDTGKKKRFYVEYCIINPELGGKTPIMGEKQFQRPAYLQVKAGVWGKGGFQISRYYGIEEMEVAPTFLKITAGECFLSENNIWGRIQQEHTMQWSLKMHKKMAFNVGYSTSKPIREINPFDMYWHAEGMRTSFEGIVTVDDEVYEVMPEECCGYADKKWGRDYTCPWFWLHGSEMKSQKTGEVLKNSAFAIGGGNPVVLGMPLWSKPFADIYYEGESHEINYSALWTGARMRYSCGMRNGKVLWHMKAVSRKVAMEVKVVCKEEELQEIDYQTPDGTKNRNLMVGGGTGMGEILLYRRNGRRYILVDKLFIKGVGCEYTGKR